MLYGEAAIFCAKATWQDLSKVSKYLTKVTKWSCSARIDLYATIGKLQKAMRPAPPRTFQLTAASF
jgi:hypothetical protein